MLAWDKWVFLSPRDSNFLPHLPPQTSPLIAGRREPGNLFSIPNWRVIEHEILDSIFHSQP